MPSKPFLEIIDRDFAIEAAQPAIEKATALLVELVNHASSACRRCMESADNRKNVHLAPFLLYRHIIEQIDGMQVLLSNSCVVASQPLLRVAFESSLQLEYIIGDDPKVFAKRSLAWLCAHYRDRLKALDKYDQGTAIGKEFTAAWAQEFRLLGPLSVPEAYLEEERAFLEEVLSSSALVDVRRELEKYPRSPWYRAYEGPTNLRELARTLGKLAYYETRYRPLSKVSHGLDAELYKIAVGDEKASVRLVRDPRNLPQTALFAAFTMLEATRSIVEFYRTGESMAAWYQREVRPRIVALQGEHVGIRYRPRKTF